MRYLATSSGHLFLSEQFSLITTLVQKCERLGTRHRKPNVRSDYRPKRFALFFNDFPSFASRGGLTGDVYPALRKYKKL